MTCPATLGPSRLPCENPDPHLPHHGCVFWGTPTDPRHNDQEATDAR
jgi:hypothetical protein